VADAQAQVADIRNTVNQLALLSRKAREQRDVLLIICIDSHLRSAIAALRAAEEREAELRSAAARGDQEQVAHQMNLILILAERARELSKAANSCVGVSSTYDGSSETRVEVDEAPIAPEPEPPLAEAPESSPTAFGATGGGETASVAQEPPVDPLAFGATGGGESFAAGAPGVVGK
jgi:hypothetical protein